MMLYKNMGFVRAFKINESFSEDGLCQFIVCLRHYCVHYRTPNITFSVHVDNTRDAISGGATLKRDALLSYDGWNAAAKAFIKTSAEPIDLAGTCSEYHAKVRAFYDWFRSEQAAIHKDVFEYLNRMERRFGSLL
jgi:hypothetical protein